MRHLPETEYTEADQRADRAFLVGTKYGYDKGYAQALEDMRNSDGG